MAYLLRRSSSKLLGEQAWLTGWKTFLVTLHRAVFSQCCLGTQLGDWFLYPKRVGIPFQKIVAISWAFQVDLPSEPFDRLSPLQISLKKRSRGAASNVEAAELLLSLTSQPDIFCKPESVACAAS